MGVARDEYGNVYHRTSAKLKQPPTHARGPANLTLCGKGGFPGLTPNAVYSSDKAFKRYCMTTREENVTCLQCRRKMGCS